MPFYARPGEAARMSFYNLPTGLAGVLGVRVLDGPAVVAHRTTAGIVELVEGLGAYLVEVAAPEAPGTYQVLVDDDTGNPGGTAVQTLEVTRLPVLGVTPDGAPEWSPTVEQVALVAPAYTRGGFDDDEYQAGAEQGTFTDSTSPTAQHVEGLILLGCEEVQARVGFTVPERCHELARTAVVWHAAAAIAAGKLPAQTDDAAGEHRSHVARYLATVEELVAQARVPRALRVG